ncbi:MAG: hypothetical protein EBR82_18000 [Caulobacteraceae bacterium]|nr:hypothetical protein [Caulobacteraceae bacterium]
MVRNKLLVRWKGGYRTRTDSGSVSTWGTHEGFLSIAGVDSAPSADSAGDTALNLYGQPRRSVTAAFEPASSGEVPYTSSLVPGSTLTAPTESGTDTFRVESLTVTEDDDGNLSYTPELTSLVETERTRTQRWLARVGNGTLAGRSATAQLLETLSPETTGGRLNTRDVSFSKGILEVSTSPSLFISKASRLTMIQCGVLAGATSPAVTFRILLNGTALSFASAGGSPATSFNLTPSVGRLVLFPGSSDHVVNEGDIVAIDLTAVAADASGFSVTATLSDFV